MHVSAVSGEDDGWNHIALVVAEIRQKIHDGSRAKRDIEHREVVAIVRKCAACIHPTCTSAVVCEPCSLSVSRTKRASPGLSSIRRTVLIDFMLTRLAAAEAA
jgi:hypothetical protein